MTMYKLFRPRAKDFYDSNNIVYQWTRKASAALRKNDVERFNEWQNITVSEIMGGFPRGSFP